ncbi:MAG TPA: PLP-dependent aminotransferase family protein [Pyrinomonadaceae bacterium]|nr:PLP-dependent aminotransferase family protein [Pyrinomonadaceae bacterium]
MTNIPLANWTQALTRSALQDMLVASTQPGLLSFALGLPAAELFPTEDFGAAMTRVLATDPRALQYGPPLLPLKRQVVELMALRGVSCREEQVFLTTGAQQGINLLVRLLLDPGGAVLLEERTYTGFQQVLQPYRPLLMRVPTDPENGVDVRAVEQALQRGPRPALLYAVTDGHNPLGVSMSLEHRERLTALARRHSLPIIEDDPYGFLCYEQAPLPPLRAFEERWVFYVGTFSKILAPAVRAGWLVVPEELVPLLANVKEASDIDMAPLSQRAVSAYLEGGALTAHLAVLRGEYRRRRDAMLDALSRHFPEEARWHKPTSGLFVWVEVPDGVDLRRLWREAIEHERVAFIPGQAFDVVGGQSTGNGLRLNFSNSRPPQIEDGIARLGRMLRRHLSSASALPPRA